MSIAAVKREHRFVTYMHAYMCSDHDSTQCNAIVTRAGRPCTSGHQMRTATRRGTAWAGGRRWALPDVPVGPMSSQHALRGLVHLLRAMCVCMVVCVLLGVCVCVCVCVVVVVVCVGGVRLAPRTRQVSQVKARQDKMRQTNYSTMRGAACREYICMYPNTKQQTQINHRVELITCTCKRSGVSKTDQHAIRAWPKLCMLRYE